jgi:hypothetical protein
MWTQHKWWNWFWKTRRPNSRFIHCTGVICENYPALSMYNWDTAVCECMVGTKMCDGSSQKLMFGGALSLLQSFKRGTNGSLESMVTLWDMVSQFYWKWAVLHWTHPSSLTATKCKVFHYAGSLWHLYSVLQESSALYSYFETQQRMWTYAVTCCADCIRLLVGRGMNVCHEVWSLSTTIQPHTMYSKHKELLQSCYWKLTVNPTYGADLAHWTIIFVPVTQQLRGHQLYSNKNAGVSAMTTVNTLPRWDKWVRVLWDCVKK